MYFLVKFVWIGMITIFLMGKCSIRNIDPVAIDIFRDP